jgi:hypothetical protein
MKTTMFIRKFFLLALSFCLYVQAEEWTYTGDDCNIDAARSLGAHNEANGVFTFEMTICPRRCESPRGEGMVCSWGNGYNNGWRIVLKAMRGGYRASFSLGNVEGLRGSHRFPGVLPTDVWTTLSVVFDGERVHLYRDGTPGGTLVRPQGAAKANPASLVLGGARHGISFFPFACSRVSLKSRPLSSEDIAIAYSSFLPEDKWSDIFVRHIANLDFEAGRFQSSAKHYARLYDNACAKKSPTRVEIGFRYAEILEKSNRKDDAKKVLSSIASAKDIPSYLVREAAEKAGLPNPCPRYPYPTTKAWKPSVEPSCLLVVSPNGKDSNSGTVEKPLATLNAALTRLREIRSRSNWPKGGAVIFLRQGKYSSKDIIELTESDSGQLNAPLIIRAWPGETPVIDGSEEILSLRRPTEEEMLRMPISARGKVRVADLPESKFGEMSPLESYGYGRTGGRFFGLIADGKLMSQARHPNKRCAVVSEASKDGVIKADFGDLSGWEKEKNVFATGYWWNFWSDRTVPVARIDPTTGTLTLADGEPYSKKGKRHEIKRKAAVFLTNALMALDSPGEYFLDREERKIFVWPEKEVSRLSLGVADKPFMTLKGTQYVVIDGIKFEGFDVTPLRMSSVSDIWVRKCVICNSSRRGLVASGERIRIEKCIFYALGRNAISLSGGSRTDLKRSNCIVTGCEAWDLSRNWRTYAPAVQVSGCGFDITHNKFHDLLSSAIRADGNDVRVVSNHIYRCVLESDDQGAFDIYANPTFAGVEIAHNVWEDIGGGDITHTGQAAVRLDDLISGVAIHDNRFVRCGRGIFGAIQINGGRRNFIDRNEFVECKRPVSIQSRTDEKWEKVMNKYMNVISSPIYQERYPGLKELPEAKENYIWRSK